MCLGELRRRNIIKYRGSEETRVTSCAACGDRIERKPSQIVKYKDNYCGRRCHATGARRPKPLLIRGQWHACTSCGRRVWRRPSEVSPQTYCSVLCANRMPRSARVERVMKVCSTCHIPMRMLPHDAKRYQYCSWRCAARSIQGAKRGLPGRRCPQEQRVRVSATLRRKWATEWAALAQRRSVEMSGRGNPRWRDGRARKPYEPGFTASLKRRVAERDGFRCQMCGAPRGYGTHAVHHIDGGKHNHAMSNLVLLCRSCHARLHHRMAIAERP